MSDKTPADKKETKSSLSPSVGKAKLPSTAASTSSQKNPDSSATPKTTSSSSQKSTGGGLPKSSSSAVSQPKPSRTPSKSKSATRLKTTSLSSTQSAPSTPSAARPKAPGAATAGTISSLLKHKTSSGILIAKPASNSMASVSSGPASVSESITSPMQKSPGKARGYAPESAKEFLQTQLNWVQAMLQVINSEIIGLKAALSEGSITTDECKMALQAANDKRTDFDLEHANLLAQEPELHEDLYDEIAGLGTQSDASIKDLYARVCLASGGVNVDDHDDYYSCCRSGSRWGERYCHVIGEWFETGLMTEAHIVPHVFAGSSLDYLFGTPDENTDTYRNGLSLHRDIETPFDMQKITFVPYDGDKTSKTSEWKLVVLDEKLMDQMAILGRTTLWKDLHNKPLKFLVGPNGENNRPARRYMYFRHIVAYMYAIAHFDHSFLTSLPSGKVWASPARPDGYLRRSALQALGRSIGDYELPDDLLEPTFTSGNSGLHGHTPQSGISSDYHTASTLAALIKANNQEVRGGALNTLDHPRRLESYRHDTWGNGYDIF